MDPTPTPTANPVEEIKTSIKTISDSLEAKPSKSDLKAINDKVEELNKKLESVIKVGDDRRGEDPNRGFKHAGEFYSEVIKAYDPTNRQVDERLRVIKAASGANLASGPDGGYTLPPAFSTLILDKMSGDSDSLLNLVETVTLDGIESLTLLANSETSRVDGSRWGGVQGKWKNEVGQMSDTHPKLREVKLEPQELYVFTYATDKMLRNSPVAMEAYFSRAAADELNFKFGDAIVNGTGSGMPLGIMNSGCKVNVAKTSNQAAATIVKTNIDKMYLRLPAKSRSSAVWLINQDTEAQLDNLVQLVTNVAGTENVGGVTWANYWNPETRRLRGLPVKTIEYAQTVGTVGDIILWDPKSYIVGRRGGLNAAMSIHLRFDYAETAFRWIAEIDGKPMFLSALTPKNGSTTYSPVVVLDTRS